ncbi:FkbM family methyltransferase [Bacillus cereus]
MLQIVDKKPSMLRKKAALFRKLYDNSTPKYIMGRNSYAKQVITSFLKRNIELAGIIDDYTSEVEYNGFPIFKTTDLSQNVLVISCVIEARLITAINYLQQNKISHILTYFDLVLHDKEHFPQVNFCENNIIDIEKNIEQYHWLYNIFDDDMSCKTLESLLDFRYNFDIGKMRIFSLRLDEQYYDVVGFSEKETFVDCGAYDGETTKRFVELNPDYISAYVFEPSPDLYVKTCKKLHYYPNVYIHQCATYHETTIQTFNSEKGSASGFSSDGNIKVKTVRLDDVIQEKVTYIKLDVEGAEYETLLGAKRLIETYKPKLAVCVYHNQEDFWRIPRLLLSYNQNYRVLLRHYTEGFLETVMYFL